MCDTAAKNREDSMSDYEEGRRLARERGHTTDPNTLSNAARQGFDDETKAIAARESPQSGSNPVAIVFFFYTLAERLFGKIGLNDSRSHNVGFSLIVENIVILSLAIGLAIGHFRFGGLISIVIALLLAFPAFLLNKAKAFRQVALFACPALWLALGMLTKGFVTSGLLRIVIFAAFGALSFFSHRHINRDFDSLEKQGPDCQ
jgi:hypothetical protein